MFLLWPDWRGEVATMKRGAADATDETGATDRSSPEPKLLSQRAGMNFVNDLDRPRATNPTGVPFTTSSRLVREESSLVAERSVAPGIVRRIRTTFSSLWPDTLGEVITLKSLHQDFKKLH